MVQLHGVALLQAVGQSLNRLVMQSFRAVLRCRPRNFRRTRAPAAAHAKFQKPAMLGRAKKSSRAMSSAGRRLRRSGTEENEHALYADDERPELWGWRLVGGELAHGRPPGAHPI